MIEAAAQAGKTHPVDATKPGSADEAATVAHPWRLVVAIALGQMLVTLDLTVVNIALPDAQRELGMSDGLRQWVVAAYALTFGSLLLLGGKMADRVGHRRALLAGLTGFAVMTLAAGLSPSGAVLVAARTGQGLCAALMSPAGLAIVTRVFCDQARLQKAVAIYSTVSGSGAAIGLVLGGLLTQWSGWRSALLIGVPVAVVAATGAHRLLPTAVSEKHLSSRLDVWGAVLATGGSTLVVTSVAAADPRRPELLTASTIAALLVVAAFVQVERRAQDPVLPLRVIADRTRAGAYLSLGLASTSMYGLFLYLTYVLQTVRGLSPLTAGLAFIPIVIALVLGSALVAGPLKRIPSRWLIAGGCLVAAGGMVMLTASQRETPYWTWILPACLAQGVGMGVLTVPAIGLGASGTAEGDAGVASAVATAVQQIGGSLGTVVINTVMATSAAAWLAGRDDPNGAELRQEAVMHGFGAAMWWGVAFLLAAAAGAVLLVKERRSSDDGTGLPHTLNQRRPQGPGASCGQNLNFVHSPNTTKEAS